MKKTAIITLIIILFGSMLFIGNINAQDDAKDLKPYISSVEESKEGMTLWQLIKAGGFIMYVLALLSITATALIIYNFMSLNNKNIIPEKFLDEVINKLEAGKKNAVKELCESRQNFVARVVMEGLDKRNKGRVYTVEAMEDCTRKEIGTLWQNISYLSDIASIAPLVGLLGTVLGMIQAFNVIAFQTAAVKPILLAGGVSKAMVTTAAGLIVAIPTMIFYSYLRGRVTQTTNLIENCSNDLIKIIEDI